MFSYFTSNSALKFGLISLFPVDGVATIDKVDRFENNINEYAYYSFISSVNGEKYKANFLHLRGGNDPNLEIGDQIEITISRYFPSQHIPAYKLTSIRSSFYIFFFGSISVLLIAFLMWNAVAYSRYK
jgi:hypothetical protein